MHCFTEISENIIRIYANYVDDSLRPDNKIYTKIWEKQKEIKRNKQEWYNLQFSGLTFETMKNVFHIHQRNYAQKHQKISNDANYAICRLLHHNMPWVNNSRPDPYFVIAKLAQNKEHIFGNNSEHISN